MIEFLLAVLICLLVCCIAAFGWPVRDSNFWTVVAPAYMQGIGTIAATVLAAMAYVAWRRPDDTRRVAEFAQTLIRESRKLELAALEARYNTYIHLEGDKADRLFAERVANFLMVVEKPVSVEKVEALRHQVNLLDTFQVEAKHYFGADTSKALSSFHDMCSELAEYFQSKDGENLRPPPSVLMVPASSTARSTKASRIPRGSRQRRYHHRKRRRGLPSR